MNDQLRISDQDPIERPAEDRAKRCLKVALCGHVTFAVPNERTPLTCKSCMKRTAS